MREHPSHPHPPTVDPRWRRVGWAAAGRAATAGRGRAPGSDRLVSVCPYAQHNTAQHSHLKARTHTRTKTHARTHTHTHTHTHPCLCSRRAHGVHVLPRSGRVPAARSTTSAPGLGSPLATSALGLGSPPATSAGNGLIPATSAPGPAPFATHQAHGTADFAGHKERRERGRRTGGAHHGYSGYSGYSEGRRSCAHPFRSTRMCSCFWLSLWASGDVSMCATCS